MFTVTLTSYGQTQISDLVQIDGIILLYEYVSDISSISNISSYTQVLDEDSAGNIKNNICNVLISDSSNNEYQAHTILFYKNNSGTKNILGGYSAEEPFIKKSISSVNLWFSFDFSAFTNGFTLSAIKAGFANASHNEDGLLHLENPNITSDDNYSVYNKSQVDALLQDKQGTLSAGDGIAISNGTVKTTGIPFGIVDDTSTATVFTVTVPGIYKLEDGVCCLLKNGVITSGSGFTLEVNGLGAKPVYSNMAAATRETTIFNVNYTMLFVYDSTRIEGGAWICYRGYFSDANSIAYQIRGNVHTLPTTAKFYRYRLLFTSTDGTHFVPSNTSTSTNATALRDVNQTPIDPFGEIVYYSTKTAVEANANPDPTYLWTQYAITLGYSFNRTGDTLALTSFSPVYIKCAPQSDGSAIIDADTPYVQTLPNTADGKIYIFLGVANSATAVELLNNHPIYYHDGTGIRIWHGKDSYSKSELDTIIADYVQTSRTINNKPLTSDITLTLDDISDGTNRSIPTINNSTITIKKNSSDTGDSFTTNAASSKTINLGLATVATSGSYNDLSDKPTATVISDSTITIKKNSDDTGDSFTTNNATAKTINLDLHTIATSGSYNDLSNKPTIPTVNDTTITIKKNTSDTGDSFTTNTATTKTINLGLSTVATSGSYNDLSNKPTIPTVNNAKLTIKKDTNDTGTEFTANASSDVTCNLGLHTVATSGSYNDLSNKPTIPTVNNSTITIKKNSSDTGDSFTTNAASGKTINLGLATVASSGSYNDLSNKPTIPVVPEDVSAFNNDAGYLTSYTETDPTVPSWAKQPSKPTYTASEVGALPSTTVIPTVNNSTITIKKNSSDTGDSFTTNTSSAKTINLGLSTVATSGSYNDLSNKPTIPTVNNATLTIQKNGTTVNTFTANASSNVTANITVPTTVAELTDAGNYAQSSSLTSLVATAQYNSTDKTIEFYNASGTKLNTDIDATAFIKDGMVDNVEITGGNLVISFNTDAGKEDIEIPISDIFDASNYYTKSQVDGLIPTVNNAKLTIKKNASDTGTEFTANASTDVTCNLGLSTVATSGSYNDLSNKPTIPVNTSDLTNDSGFITSSDLPTNHVTTDTSQSITGQKTFVTASGGGTGNDIKIAFVENAQHYITVASSAEYNNDYISPYFRMSFIGNSGDISTYIETKATYTYNQSSDEYDLTDIVSASELSNTWSLGSNRSMLKSVYTNEINNSFTNAISFASTETAFNKEVNLVLAKDTNTYIYGGNKLPDDDYRHWWTNYDQVGTSYTSISISMTEEERDDTILTVPINELNSVTPFGKLIVNTSVYGFSIDTTSVTDSLKDLIDSDSINPVDEYIFLCFDDSIFPSNIIGVIICAELLSPSQPTSEKLMFFIPSDDLELANYEYNQGQGTYCIVNNSGSYSFNNGYNFNYRIIAKTSIRDYVDDKINSIISNGVDYADYASSAGSADTATAAASATYAKRLSYSTNSQSGGLYASSSTITFSRSSILPSNSITYNLGSANYPWQYIYANDFISYGDKSNYPKHCVIFGADSGNEIDTTRVSSITSYTINDNQAVFYLITEVNTNSSYALTSAITIPKSTNVWSLGTDSLALKEIYISGSNSSYMAVLGNSGNSSYVNPTIRPTTDKHGNLGLPDYKWGYIYGTYLGNSSNYFTSAYITTINGTTFTGTASNATIAIYASNIGTNSTNSVATYTYSSATVRALIPAVTYSSSAYVNLGNTSTKWGYIYGTYLGNSSNYFTSAYITTINGMVLLVKLQLMLVEIQLHHIIVHYQPIKLFQVLKHLVGQPKLPVTCTSQGILLVDFALQTVMLYRQLIM